MKNLIIATLITASAVAGLVSCSKNVGTVKPKTFVLVHGAWMAPYAWDNVKTGLEKQGQQVIVVELPGHGNDQTAPQKISLDVYRDKVISDMSAAKGDIVLV